MDWVTLLRKRAHQHSTVNGNRSIVCVGLDERRLKENFMKKKQLVSSFSLACVIAIALGSANAVAAKVSAEQPKVTVIASGLHDVLGSAVGRGGVLYVAESTTGKILRIDPKSGAITLFASGLPTSTLGLGGGTMDVAFIGNTAYALETLVSKESGGGSSKDGIYRIDSPTKATVIADLGAWSVANPPTTTIEVPSGLQYAFEPYQNGFIVTDGHHNRVLRVTRDGKVSQVVAFENVVPTGIAVSGNNVYIAESGPLPHSPQFGKVITLEPKQSKAPAVKELASGAPLVVDVKFNKERGLYAISQGEWPGQGTEAGTPAQANTGKLVRVNKDGTFSDVVTGLDRPTSLQFIGTTAYVTTLAGDVLKIEGISGPPYGK
jgi:sugar lactone lactonase YvrE